MPPAIPVSTRHTGPVSEQAEETGHFFRLFSRLAEHPMRRGQGGEDLRDASVSYGPAGRLLAGNQAVGLFLLTPDANSNRLPMR